MVEMMLIAYVLVCVHSFIAWSSGDPLLETDVADVDS
jgi:hypothetical protein